MGTYYCFRGHCGCDHIVVITTKVVSSQGLNIFQKVHWTRTSKHQESTGPEHFSIGPEYRNGRNNIC